MNNADFHLNPEDIILEDTSISQQVNEIISKEREFIEDKVQMAILADYDGVDINYKSPVQSFDTDEFQYDLGIQSIEPWRGDPPKSDNGFRTERYSWEWFDNEELKQYIVNDDIDKLLERLS